MTPRKLNVYPLDSEVYALMSDLGLVLRDSQEFVRYKMACLRSRFTLYPLCARYKDFLKLKKQFKDILCRELYKRNRSRSRYVYASYKCD